jgi:hypothetical protein
LQRDERYHVPLQVVWNSSEWRFDLTLWLVDDHAHIADWHQQLGERISPEQRRAVLRIKDVWCRRPDYPDEISGAEISSAVLEDGIRTPDAFARWLLEHRPSRDSETWTVRQSPRRQRRRVRCSWSRSPRWVHRSISCGGGCSSA